MAVSHIMLEAYKKYILVSLILHGKVQPLPKYTSQIVGRFIKVRANSMEGMNIIRAFALLGQQLDFHMQTFKL